jgi:hypothetical protein
LDETTIDALRTEHQFCLERGKHARAAAIADVLKEHGIKIETAAARPTETASVKPKAREAR